MTHPHDLTLTPLARHALLRLAGGTGRAVGVFSGGVWITEEGVLADHVLAAGESMALRRPGLVLVEALQDSQLILFETAESSSAAPAAGHGRTAGTGSDAAAPARLSVEEYQRLGRALRQQAIADAVTWLVRTVRRVFTGPTTPRPALPRPGPALVCQDPR